MSDQSARWKCRNCASMSIPDDFIHCPGCGTWRPGYEPSDPMPPFPQEPAFGSPEAVERSAETMRGFAPGPWSADGATEKGLEAERQRDALADALGEILNYSGGANNALEDPYVMKRAEAALRLAGLLPEVADGPHS